MLAGGWLHTDVAIMDEDGFFVIVDRKKDIIITGGYNIYPREIEEVLYAHPQIHEAVVIGTAHEVAGQVVKAYIVPRQGETLTRREVPIYCQERLAKYKVPRQIEFRESLPKTLTWKSSAASCSKKKPASRNVAVASRPRRPRSSLRPSYIGAGARRLSGGSNSEG